MKMIKQTSIILQEDQKRQLDEMAKNEDRTRSQLIRIAIKKLLEEKKNETRN